MKDQRHFHHWSINPIIEVENNHKFSLNAVRSSYELARRRTKVGLKKVVDIRLSFPCLRLTVETLQWILKYICTILTAFRKFLDMTNQGFRWNANQFNGSLLRIIVEKKNAVNVAGENGLP